jgi:hypothetical protein
VAGVTLVVGASPNPARYAFEAANLLVGMGHEMIPIGIKRGKVAGREILDLRSRPLLNDIDTITLYIGARHQPEWYDYLLSLAPIRVIFNPGAENPEFAERCEQEGIEAVEGCTLVMLRTGQY